ncbi:ribulose-phosphate 3-epimerase [Fructilactobacillus fructivorans]|uniref:Ribulose-phosphate 3-epimerase n=1 Tax=Fructilactobacillus fructivorans TaxID=1614 RepID=A0A0C1Q2W8_9LACO|nr:ribulose-phosphate 3-epimerase [Fructilactobacillus fructivorans]KID42158.1 Ribulose-phosphate 3-epimerase [Fructilactobacillus fructivorans]KRK58599.1 ribulose-phosphate 3-epimerase [Fructilactobacillus fructivorans]KRN13506.1 ribulose-phosphate 3-epimerase [Fructilactobacillus fructivorans]KRN43516.1 ribulose-phosphate 3-epimerase [Fructilactobacillus fructivorans]MCT0152051.1 ribulose-phosphate 3-epimerase [Fructilactobacillus fructivorans]
MIKVAPSILSADYVNLQKDIEKVDKGGAELLHIDIMDGMFVPSIAYGPGWVKEIRPITGLTLDCHLMIENPERYINTFADAGADIIGVHVESTPHIHRALQMIKDKNVKAEVVINPGTPVEMIKPVLYMVDQVLVMTVNPGFGGQKFIPETISKIKELNRLREENDSYSYDIEIDGGVNDQTVVGAYNAGANVAVAGSYVFDAKDPAARIQALKDATNF